MTREGHTVGGTSIMGLMMLAAGQGHAILIEAEGADARAALEALIVLIEFGLRRRGLASGTSGTLVAGDHGADQILMMRKARQIHRSDVRENQCEGEVRQEHVRPLYGLAGLLTEYTGKRPRLMFPSINHNAGCHRRSKEEKKENHHGAAARAMPDIAFGAN